MADGSPLMQRVRCLNPVGGGGGGGGWPRLNSHCFLIPHTSLDGGGGPSCPKLVTTFSSGGVGGLVVQFGNDLECSQPLNTLSSSHAFSCSKIFGANTPTARKEHGQRDKHWFSKSQSCAVYFFLISMTLAKPDMKEGLVIS